MATDDAKQTEIVTHAPAPNNTPPGQGTGEVTVPRAQEGQSGTVNVQLTSVHNWVELVYKAFGQTLPTGKKELAILGVREASIQGTGASKKVTGDALEKKAEDGKTTDVDFTESTREGDMGKSPTTWNDLLFVVSVPEKVEDQHNVDVYQCTIDPGKKDKSAVATPYLLEGKLYKCYPGSHIAKKYKIGKSTTTALHIYHSAKENILLAREATNKSRIFKTLPSAAHNKGKFVTEEANGSVHMHFGSTGATVGGWSTGCTVLKHAITSERYLHFRKTFMEAPNKEQIPYLVVSSEYVRSYGEWVKEIDKEPGKTPEPSTVIEKDQLRSPKNHEGKYLPSIMTTEFANAIIDENNANKTASLELALFTVSN